MHAQGTLEPSGGSNASMASPSNGINTFQVGERRDAPPSGLLPQVWYQHAQAKGDKPGLMRPFYSLSSAARFLAVPSGVATFRDASVHA